MRFPALIMLLPAVLSCACQQRTLAEDNTRAQVLINGASGTTQVMRVLIYDADENLTTTFVAPTGGAVSLPAGTYDILLHSFGCEMTTVSGEETHGPEASTGRADASSRQLYNNACSRAAKADGRIFGEGVPQLLWQPDMMDCARRSGLSVPHRGSGSLWTLEMDAEQLVKESVICLDDVQGAQWIAAADAFVVGVAASVDMFSGVRDGVAAVHCTLDGSGDRLEGRFRHFGFSDMMSQVLLVVLTDMSGARHLFIYGIGECDETMTVVEISSGIRIEKPETNDNGGFAPSLEDWGTVNIPVRL